MNKQNEVKKTSVLKQLYNFYEQQGMLDENGFVEDYEDEENEE